MGIRDILSKRKAEKAAGSHVVELASWSNLGVHPAVAAVNEALPFDFKWLVRRYPVFTSSGEDFVMPVYHWAHYDTKVGSLYNVDYLLDYAGKVDSKVGVFYNRKRVEPARRVELLELALEYDRARNAAYRDNKAAAVSLEGEHSRVMGLLAGTAKAVEAEYRLKTVVSELSAASAYSKTAGAELVGVREQLAVVVRAKTEGFAAVKEAIAAWGSVSLEASRTRRTREAIDSARDLQGRDTEAALDTTATARVIKDPAYSIRLAADEEVLRQQQDRRSLS